MNREAEEEYRNRELRSVYEIYRDSLKEKIIDLYGDLEVNGDCRLCRGLKVIHVRVKHKIKETIDKKFKIFVYDKPLLVPCPICDFDNYVREYPINRKILIDDILKKHFKRMESYSIHEDKELPF
uniref:Uncharacterized protein n=1 Tax=viral metagenome TaxID=1070528 RepID=A0A6H1ZHS6_9ZZZZ